MDSFLTGIPNITNVGAGGLVVLFVILVATGRLVPSALHKAIRDDLISQRDTLLRANEVLITTNASQAKAIQDLTDAGRVSVRVMEALRTSTEIGDSHVGT